MAPRNKAVVPLNSARDHLRTCLGHVKLLTAQLQAHKGPQTGQDHCPVAERWPYLLCHTWVLLVTEEEVWLSALGPSGRGPFSDWKAGG